MTTPRCWRRPWSAWPTSAGARCRARSSCCGPVRRSAGGGELIDWVRDRLAHFKAPRRVDIVDELPKGGTGKVQKRELREWPLMTEWVHTGYAQRIHFGGRRGRRASPTW